MPLPVPFFSNSKGMRRFAKFIAVMLMSSVPSNPVTVPTPYEYFIRLKSIKYIVSGDGSGDIGRC